MKLIGHGFVVMVLSASCARSEAPQPVTPAAATAPSGPSLATTASGPASSSTETRCARSTRDTAVAQGGLCLESAVVGADQVSACSAWFVDRGWVHDGDAESAIGGRLGKTLVCYHAP